MKAGGFGRPYFYHTTKEMEVKECLPNLVGITNIDCPCTEVPNGKNYNITESDSGYFLTQFIDLNVGKLDCDQANDLFDNLNNHMNKGYDDFAGLLKDTIKKNHTIDPRMKAWNDYLGSNNPTSISETRQEWHGFELHSRGISNTYMTIKEITVKSKAPILANTQTVKIVDNFGNTHFATRDFTTGANLVVTVRPNITLDLYNDENEDLKYYVVHDIQSISQNLADCGCGGAERKRYKNYVWINGAVTADIQGLNGYTNSKTAWGMRIKAEMGCSFQDTFCRMTDEQSREYAKGVLRMATVNVIEWLMARQNVNEYTVLGFEGMENLAMVSQVQAEKAAKWLASDMDFTPCYNCGKPGYGVKRMLK